MYNELLDTVHNDDVTRQQGYLRGSDGTFEVTLVTIDYAAVERRAIEEIQANIARRRIQERGDSRHRF
jgi:hypothetical protein